MPMPTPMPTPPGAHSLILFDLDGTLVETAPEIADAVNDTLTALGLDAVSEQQVSHWIGHGTRELLIHALAHALHTPAAQVRHSPGFADMQAIFDVHYSRRCASRSRLYPQVLPTLHALRNSGVHLAIITNKEQRYTDKVLAAHGLQTLFGQVISGDSLPVKKPDPSAVRHCMQRWGASAAQTLFVGDSSIDIATARNAGIRVWALPYGYNMGQPIEASQPDRVIQDISALVSI